MLSKIRKRVAEFFLFKKPSIISLKVRKSYKRKERKQQRKPSKSCCLILSL
jgi:hypothetical protein